MLSFELFKFEVFKEFVSCPLEIWSYSIKNKYNLIFWYGTKCSFKIGKIWDNAKQYFIEVSFKNDPDFFGTGVEFGIEK